MARQRMQESGSGAAHGGSGIPIGELSGRIRFPGTQCCRTPCVTDHELCAIAKDTHQTPNCWQPAAIGQSTCCAKMGLPIAIHSPQLSRVIGRHCNAAGMSGSLSAGSAALSFSNRSSLSAVQQPHTLLSNSLPSFNFLGTNESSGPGRLEPA